MPRPPFYLQIVDGDGVVLRTSGGGPLERELVVSLTNAIVARGVGVFRTEAHVRAAIAEGVTDVIRILKHETVPLVTR